MAEDIFCKLFMPESKQWKFTLHTDSEVFSFFGNNKKHFGDVYAKLAPPLDCYFRKGSKQTKRPSISKFIITFRYGVFLSSTDEVSTDNKTAMDGNTGVEVVDDTPKLQQTTSLIEPKPSNDDDDLPFFGPPPYALMLKYLKPRSVD